MISCLCLIFFVTLPAKRGIAHLQHLIMERLTIIILSIWLALPVFSQEIRTEQLDSVAASTILQNQPLDNLIPMNEPLQSSPSLSSFGFDPCKDYSLDEKYGAGNMQERLSISPNALPQFSPQSDFVVPAFSAYRISDQVTGGDGQADGDVRIPH